MSSHSGNTTAPIESEDPLSLSAATAEVPALVIAWSAHQPERVGEVALLDGDGPWLLGRGLDEEPPRRRVRFFRRRPGALVETGPLLGDTLSRRALLLDRRPIGIEIARAGAAKLLVNGALADGAVLARGDALEIRGLFVFLFTGQPRELPLTAYASSAFGEPDAHGILGESPAAWRLRDRIAFAASAAPHVLLHGESGTGKELAARAIHALSPRARGPLVARNAATFPAGLIDAELFGNVKSYPNPGTPERPGLVGEASGGTLFLDEIAELPLEMQAHLLRVLDHGGEYHRLGEAKARRADVRLIGATNRDPSAALKHDLLARLTLRVELPALDARREDIPLLARHLVLRAAEDNPHVANRFVRRVAGGRDEIRVDPRVITALVRRDYTTNVRELEALLWGAISATMSDTLGLTDELRAPTSPRARPSSGPARVDRETEQLVGGLAGAPTAAQVRAMLVRHKWQIQVTADALSMNRHALRRLIGKYGIEPE